MANRTDEKAVLNLVINGQPAKTTMKELSDGIRKYESEIKNLKKADNPAEYEAKAKAVRTLKAALAEAKKEVNGVTQESTKFQSSWKDIAKGVLAGGFIQQGLSMLKDFGGEVIQTYAKYEKFLAVLENTLGSSQAARLAFNDIKQFAKETPFQLDELTESYVKLVNRGFQPSIEQMRKLGDLAASQGKSFDMLTEAVLDAGTGEFERLKEFGIRASKNGDMVSLSFKGITKEVKFNEQAINDAIIAYGELDGVQNAMAKTSATVGGRISNLSDSWDQLLSTIGSRTGGVIFTAVSAIGGYLDWLNEALKTTEEKISDRIDKKVNATLANFKQLPKDSLDPWVKTQQSQIEGTIALIKDYEAELAKFQPTGKTAQEMQAYYRSDKPKQAENYKQLIEEQKRTLAGYQDVQKQEVAAKQKAEDEKARLQKIADQKLAAEQKKKADAAKKAAVKAEESLANDIKKIREDLFQNALSQTDAEVEAARVKYEALRALAKGNKDKIVEIDNLEAIEQQQILQKQQDAVKKEAEKRYAERIAQQEKVYQLGMDSREKEQLATDQAFEELINATDAAGLDSTTIYQKWTDAKLAIDEEYNQKSLEKSKELEEQRKEVLIGIASDVASSVFSIMANGRQAELESTINSLNSQRDAELQNKNLTESQKDAINRKYEDRIRAEKKKAWQADQRAAITQAIINGGLAVTKVLAQTGILSPFVIPAIVAGTAAQIAVIAAQKAPQFAKGGFVPEGPSHASGGIKMVDNLTGAVVGEMEGGEPVLSKETYRNNKGTIDALLYAGQRKNGARISIDRGMIASNERYYRTGGVVSTAANSSSSTTSPGILPNSDIVERLLTIIESQQKITEIPVVFSHREFEDSTERRVKIRSGVNA